MRLWEIFLLALALSADAFSVGAAVGLRHNRFRQIFRLSFHFGLFQALMPLVGVLLGTLLLELVKTWDHWIASLILVALGVKMAVTALRGGEERAKDFDLTRGKSLIALSLAVSIDALAAGIGLPAANAPIATSIAIIGAVAMLATAAAMMMAEFIGRRFGKWSEVIAGVVLVLLGVKILWEHIAGL